MRASTIFTDKGNWSFLADDTVGEKLDRYKSRFVALRDDIRTALEGSLFTVSDIATWNEYSDNTGHAFVVKLGDREWLFMASVDDAFVNYFGRVFGNYDSTTCQSYFIEKDGTAATNTSISCNISIHYNCGVASYGMGFDGVEPLTYSTGDHTAPGSSPYSATETFMPVTIANEDQCLRGLTSTWQDWSSSPDDFSRYLFVFDDASPSITWYSTGDGTPLTYSVSLFGNALVNTDGADLNTELVLSLQLSHSSSAVGGHNSTDEFVFAFNGLGERAEFNLNRDTDFTPENALTTAGEYKWKPVSVSNANYDKGVINTDLVRVAGVYNSLINYGTILDGPTGPLFRCGYNLVFPYAANIERFPWPETA